MGLFNETGPGNMARLLFILSVVALIALGSAIIWVARTGSDQGPPSDDSPPLLGAHGFRLYEFVNWDELRRLTGVHDVIIVKGPATETQLKRARKVNPGARLVNYEQAFVLNVDEADHARTQGWLATTCRGQEISPRNLPRATLLDPTIPAAREWRTDLVAKETRALGYDFNYIDTLRSYFPADFYDGPPCKVSDAAWLEASIATVNLVQGKTGKAVIANGNGMQTGLQYFGNREAVDQIVATADAVQVERFGGFRSDLDRDLAFVEAINTAGKDAYVKCRRPGGACRDLLAEIAGRGAVYLSVHR